MTQNAKASTPARAFGRRSIRVRKEDSAFVYFILESYEGIVSYSTLAFRPGEAHRDLELRIPPDFRGEVEAILARLNDEGVKIHELDDLQ